MEIKHTEPSLSLTLVKLGQASLDCLHPCSEDTILSRSLCCFYQFLMWWKEIVIHNPKFSIKLSFYMYPTQLHKSSHLTLNNEVREIQSQPSCRFT